MEKLFNFELRQAPKPVKALALGYLLALSLAYVYAIGHIFHAVGWTPDDIATHYYGATQRVVELELDDTGEVSFSLDDIVQEKPKLGLRPSFRNLVATGHFHLFGMSSFFFGLCLLGLFVRLGETWKCRLVFAPFVAVIIDNLSFLATRFGGPEFAYLTAVAGGLMALSFSALWILIMREIFAKGNS